LLPRYTSKGVTEGHLAAPTLNGLLALRGLAVLLFLVGQAKLGDRQNISLEGFSNQFPANPNPTEVSSAGIVAKQIGVGCLLPELGFIGFSGLNLCL